MNLANEYVVTMLTDDGEQKFNVLADTPDQAEDEAAKLVKGSYAEVVSLRQVPIGGSK